VPRPNRIICARPLLRPAQLAGVPNRQRGPHPGRRRDLPAADTGAAELGRA